MEPRCSSSCSTCSASRARWTTAKLEKNNVGPSSSTGALAAKGQQGDLLVANGDVQMNLASIKDGQCTCRVFFPADAKAQEHIRVALRRRAVNNAPNKDKGKQLIDFLLSQQAQQTVSSVASEFPVRDDVQPSDANYAEVKKADDRCHGVGAGLEPGVSPASTAMSRPIRRPSEAEHDDYRGRADYRDSIRRGQRSLPLDAGPY